MNFPVLDIYRIIVSKKGKDKTGSCFKDLLQTGCIGIKENDNKEVFNEFVKAFIKKLDTEGCYPIENSKKVVTIRKGKSIAEEGFNISVNEFIFSGVLQAGNYGDKNFTIPIQNKDDQQIIPQNIALTKEFFFFIWLPPQSHEGVLMIQSYNNTSYFEHMKSFLNRELLKSSDYIMTKYIPMYLRSLQDSILNRKITKSITYINKIRPTNRIGSIEPIAELGGYDISITIKPSKGSKSTITDINDEFEKLVTKRKRGYFGLKKATIDDSATGKTYSYTLDDVNSLKPRIMLTNYIKVDEDGNFEINDLYLKCQYFLKELISV